MTEIDLVKLIPKKPKQVLCHQLANGPSNRVCSLRGAIRKQSAQGWSMPSLKLETRNCRTQLETLTSPWSPWFKAIVFAKPNCLIHVVTLTQNELSTKGTHDMPQQPSPSSPPSLQNQMNTRNWEKGCNVIGSVVLISFKSIFRISFSASVSAICGSTFSGFTKAFTWPLTNWQ